VNWYGATAMRHWARWRPRAYAGISDPDAFFTELGEEMAAQVEELADYLAGEDRPDEGYLDRVARLFTVRMVAEEIVLPQRVWPEPSPGRSRERGDRQRALRRAGTGVPGPPGCGRKPGATARHCAGGSSRITSGLSGGSWLSRAGGMRTGSPARIVGEGHRSAAEHVEIRHYAAPGQPFAQAAEGILDARPVKQGRGIAHAASIS
jgi:hypothetical protein